MDVRCDKCKGKGKIPLTEELARTYEAVRSGLQTSEEIYRADKHRKFFGRTAINRRLDRLFDLGLLSRQRRGQFIYFRILTKAELAAKPSTQISPHARR